MLYTLGYSGRSLADVWRLVQVYTAVLVDIRFRAASRRPDFRQPTLQAHLGTRYVHCPALGNVNYKGGAVQLQDYASGRDQIRLVVHEAGTVILMCVCAHLDACHRAVAGTQLSQDLHVPLVHL